MAIARIALLLILTVSTSRLARAQDENGGSTPSASPLEEKRAYVRVWSMAFGGNEDISVTAKSDEEDARSIFHGKGDQPHLYPYVELKKGSTTISLVAGSESPKQTVVELAPDDFNTALITRQNGAYKLQVLQDPAKRQKDFPPTLRIFNFGSNRTAFLAIGKDQPVEVPPNTFTEVPLPEHQVVAINVTVPNPEGGAPAKSSTEVSTKDCLSWSLTCIPDYRNRIRPRVYANGPQ